MSLMKQENALPDLDPVVRPKVAAELLGVSKPTLWRLHRNGLLAPPLRISAGVTGWRRSTLERFLAEREAEAAAAGAAVGR